MAQDLTQYLDPDHDTIAVDFVPEWYVVESTVNNSRNIRPHLSGTRLLRAAHTLHAVFSTPG